MNVLSIGTDESVFEKGSAARARQEAYAKALGRLDLVVLSKKPHEAQSDGTLSLRAAKALSPLGRLLRARGVSRALPRPDIVSAQDPFEIGFVGWLVARRFKASLHVQVHTDFLAPEYARHSLANRIRVWIAGFTLKRAVGIRVVSERIKKEIEENYRPRAQVSVLPIFVDTEKFRHAKAPPELAARFGNFKTKLLVVARLAPEKNVELAIRAFASSAPGNACLIVVGDGSAGERLKALARALHRSDRIFFEGAQDPAPYYALADLVLVPSKYEGYGLVIVEALATGKPVLSKDVGVAREAGAIISSEKDFAGDLAVWLTSGSRQAKLKQYPYKNFDEYVHAYCADLAACAKK